MSCRKAEIKLTEGIFMNIGTDQTSKSKNLPSERLVPIRTVASQTGVNPVTLRAWERRYGLIKPIRTPKGHRLYTTADIDLINQIVALLEAGMSIGQVRQVLESDKGTPPGEAPGPDPWINYHSRLIKAIINFDERALDAIYNETLSLYPVDIVTSRLIVPLLRDLGWRWERTEGSVAEEHFFSTFLRNKLGARFHHRSRDRHGPKLLAACLPGEQHEIGILLFALSALDRDYQVVLLGANMPLAELPQVAERAGCQAIVLSGYLEIPNQMLRKDFPQMVRQAGVPVFIGGKVIGSQADELSKADAIVLGDDLNLALHKIGALLA